MPPGSAELPAVWQEGLLVADRFRIIRFVGQGGMGKVYLAQDETLGRPTALKRVPQEIIFDADARDDLRQEANRLLDLAHEHIVRIHTFYDGPTWPFFAMEYLQGPTLKKLLRTRKQYGKTFTPAEVLAVARQVAQGLSYAHAKGIIHRDLKPANLILAAPPAEEITGTDVVKITDFGVSRVIADSTMRHTGKRTGTLPYMSPEQFHGEPCTVQSDVYSMACTLYELLAGNPPFHSGDLGYQIVHVTPKPLTGVPRVMADAIIRGLSKDPRRRFQSVEEFLQALEGRPSAARGLGPAARLRIARLVAAVLVVALLGVLALEILPRGDPVETPGPGGGAGVGPGSSPGVGPGSGSGGEPAAGKAPDAPIERVEFAARLREEIDKQIPSLVGKKHPAATFVAPDALTLKVVFQEPKGSSYKRILFQGLFLQHYTQDAKGEKPIVQGEIAEGRKTFTLDALKDGTYTLKAYVEERGTGGTRSVVPLLDDAPRKFVVDLTPPTFEIEPVDPGLFLSVEKPVYTTFYPSAWLKLSPVDGLGDLDDVAEAHFQIDYGMVLGPYARMDGLLRHHVELPPGDLRFRVYAVDAAQNESVAKEITLRRQRLEIESFALADPDGVVGNRARVAGVLEVEGDKRPQLLYFINDGQAEPIALSEAGTAASPTSGAPGITRIPFGATLVLPADRNTIEVRYACRDNPPASFTPAARIPDVKVKGPAITLSDLPTHTSSTHLLIQGRVDPVFDDLEVYLDHVGRGAPSRLTLYRTSQNPPSADFSQEIDLVPDAENAFRIQCFYRKSRIDTLPVSFSVLCDTTPPALAGKVRFEPAEGRLNVLISPLDDLRQVRVREAVGGGATQWKLADWDAAVLAYRYVARVPLSSMVLQIELTDLAGNTAIVDESFSPGGQEDLLGRPRPGEIGDRAPAPDPAAPLPDAGPAVGPSPAKGVAGVPWIVSPFLAEVGMEFVPFGSGRWEMGKTEVTERAWSLFLKDARGAQTQGPGRTDYPMVLRDSAPDLLREFVKWFEKRADDGYAYAIPTPEQWQSAFVGVSDPGLAPSLLRGWFRGYWEGSGPPFDPSPRERYGKNTVLPIGRRDETTTPTGLVDMVANVQEIVLDGEVMKVIGGSNRDTDVQTFEDHCLRVRMYDLDARTFQGNVTGVRLCRRPASVR